MPGPTPRLNCCWTALLAASRPVPSAILATVAVAVVADLRLLAAWLGPPTPRLLCLVRGRATVAAAAEPTAGAPPLAAAAMRLRPGVVDPGSPGHH